MPLGSFGGGGGVKGPRSNNMPRAPRNVNPALIGTKTDFIVFLYKHCSVFSGKLTHVITKFILYSALFIR